MTGDITIDHARTGSAPAKVFSLTDRESAMKLPRPDNGKRDYHVRGIGGMLVRVSSTGNRSYVVRKRAPENRVKENRDTPMKVWQLVVGDVGVMEVDEAKTKARDLIGRIERGEDPTKAVVSGMTLQEAFDKMMNEATTLRPRTRSDWNYRFKRHITDKNHGSTSVASVDKDWIRARMCECVKTWEGEPGSSMPKRGGAEGNRLRTILNVVFKKWFGRNNVVGQCDKFKCERRRKQRLTIAQIRLYIETCERYARGEGRVCKYVDDPYQQARRRTVADFLIITVLTALRRKNGLGLKWEWIDFKSATIRIPSDEMKTGNTTDALESQFNAPPAAMAILKRRYDNEYRHDVFVFSINKTSPPLASPNKAHLDILKLAGLPTNKEHKVRIHDQRRSLGSAMIESGAGVAEVAHQLGHQNVATTSIYLNLDDGEKVKKSLARTSAAIFGEGSAA